MICATATAVGRQPAATASDHRHDLQRSARRGGWAVERALVEVVRFGHRRLSGRSRSETGQVSGSSAGNMFAAAHDMPLLTVVIFGAAVVIAFALAIARGKGRR
jgi:hypothetical protein